MARRSGLRRIGVGVIDQGLYSAANFALTVVVARATTPREFGLFALVQATYLVVVAVSRGLTSETFVVRYSRDEATRAVARWRWGASAAGGTSTAVGVLVGLVLVLVGLLALDDGGTVVAFGVLLPGLVVQDFYRFAALALGRPGYALLNDAVTVAVQFGVSGVLIATGHATAVTLVVAWGGAAWIGALVGVALLHVPPRPDRVVAWFAQHRDLALRYAADDVASQSSQVSGYVVAGVDGLSDAGALRAAQTVFNPPSIANMSVMVAVTPELVRVLHRSPRRMRRLVGYLALSQVAFALLWAAAALLAPTSVGRALFGSTWVGAHPLLPLLAVAQIGIGLRVGPMAGLRALGDGRRTLRARLYVTGLMWVATIGAALLDGAHGVAVAMAVANPVQAGIWWWQYRIGMAAFVAGDGDPLVDTDPYAAAAGPQAPAGARPLP